MAVEPLSSRKSLSIETKSISETRSTVALLKLQSADFFFRIKIVFNVPSTSSDQSSTMFDTEEDPVSPLFLAAKDRIGLVVDGEMPTNELVLPLSKLVKRGEEDKIRGLMVHVDGTMTKRVPNRLFPFSFSSPSSSSSDDTCLDYRFSSSTRSQIHNPWITPSTIF